MPPKPRTGHVPRPRKKACIACSDSKTRCDHKTPCTRCQIRELECTYAGKQHNGTLSGQSHAGNLPKPPQKSDSRGIPAVDISSAFNQSTEADPAINGAVGHESRRYEPLATCAVEPNLAGPQQSQPDLLCTVDASRIQTRWLRAFLLEPGEQEKHPPPGLHIYYFRMLKAWTSMAINNSGTPPFVHASQLQGLAWCKPLINCCSLLRVLDGRLPGSEELSSELLSREMKKLYDEHTSYDALTLFAAFQAYLLYSMAIFFQLPRDSDDALRQAIVNLQQLACATALHGVITPGELVHSRPDWRTWVVAETKRRAIYTMYMFDNLLCARDGIPVYLGTELSGLPIPASRNLWRASTQHEWEIAYNLHLSLWQKTNMVIDDLWPVPSTLSTPEIAARTVRVDRWLEGVDEFGTMLYAVTCCTHGG